MTLRSSTTTESTTRSQLGLRDWVKVFRVLSWGAPRHGNCFFEAHGTQYLRKAGIIT